MVHQKILSLMPYFPYAFDEKRKLTLLFLTSIFVSSNNVSFVCFLLYNLMFLMILWQIMMCYVPTFCVTFLRDASLNRITFVDWSSLSSLTNLEEL